MFEIRWSVISDRPLVLEGATVSLTTAVKVWEEFPKVMLYATNWLVVADVVKEGTTAIESVRNVTAVITKPRRILLTIVILLRLFRKPATKTYTPIHSAE